MEYPIPLVPPVTRALRPLNNSLGASCTIEADVCTGRLANKYIKPLFIKLLICIISCYVYSFNNFYQEQNNLFLIIPNVLSVTIFRSLIDNPSRYDEIAAEPTEIITENTNLMIDCGIKQTNNRGIGTATIVTNNTLKTTSFTNLETGKLRRPFIIHKRTALTKI
jgi:hypothetical protein